MDRYFDFLKKNLASIPTGGTELGENFKDYTDNNITSMQDFSEANKRGKKLSRCNEDSNRILANDHLRRSGERLRRSVCKSFHRLR